MTGPQSSSKLVDQDEPLDSEEHSVYRSTVGETDEDDWTQI